MELICTTLVKTLHFNTRKWDDQTWRRLYQKRKKLHTEIKELIKQRFQTLEAQQEMSRQGIKFKELETQIQRLKKQWFLPEVREMMHTSKQETNRSRCRRGQHEQRSTKIGCKNVKQACHCKQYALTINNKMNVECSQSLEKRAVDFRRQIQKWTRKKPIRENKGWKRKMKTQHHQPYCLVKPPITNYKTLN